MLKMLGDNLQSTEFCSYHLINNKISVEVEQIKYFEFKNGTICNMIVKINIPVKIYDGDFSSSAKKGFISDSFSNMDKDFIKESTSRTIVYESYGSAFKDEKCTDEREGIFLMAQSATCDAEDRVVQMIIKNYKTPNKITVNDIFFIKTPKDYI